jgi:uroporphyrinogen-III decarboxylase
VAAAKATDEWVVIQGGHRTFERLQWLRGYENLMLDLATGSPELERLADMIVEHSLSYVRRSIAVGADGVGFQDDWGTQNALMINPKTWREFFKPRYRRMFEPAKAAGMLVTFHSDGHLLEVLDDFREVGVDVLNPQTNCQDMEELGRRARARRLCISADIDRQGVMSFGSPADVKAYFHRLAMSVGGPEGGLMFSCETGSETPFENIEAAFQVVQEYRERKGAAA